MDHTPKSAHSTSIISILIETSTPTVPPLSLMDNFGTGTKCLSKSNVCLIESQRSKGWQGQTLRVCFTDVSTIVFLECSVEKESTLSTVCMRIETEVNLEVKLKIRCLT